MHDMPPRKTHEVTAEQLLQLLDKYGVPYGEWGTTPGTKTLKNLLDEITAGEAWLVEDERGLTRVTNGLGLDVVASVDGTQYMLVETRQEYMDGTVRQRHLSTSLGEKIKGGEEIMDVLDRALREELGVDLASAVAYGVGDTESRPRESGSYPGLATVVILNHAVVQLSPEQFKPEGYMEERLGRKRVYFEWEPARGHTDGNG